MSTTATSKFGPAERDALQQMVRSAGWKIVMQNIITPLLMQTNARLEAFGTTEQETQFHRGVKHTLKRLMEDLYNLGELPNPFEEHMQAFLTTLAIQHQPTLEEDLQMAKKEVTPPVRIRGRVSPVF